MICDFKILRIRVFLLAVLGFKNVALLVLSAKWIKDLYFAMQFYRTIAAILLVLVTLFVSFNPVNLRTSFVLGKWQKSMKEQTDAMS
jgi:hypothetical protein